MDSKITKVSELTPFRDDWNDKVRVIRLWKLPDFNNPLVTYSIEMVLMDEEVVKVADFGVARVKAKTGVMTEEMGTYRWMAPEVVEHKPYDHKVDVFSFGVVLWELLTGKIYRRRNTASKF